MKAYQPIIIALIIGSLIIGAAIFLTEGRTLSNTNTSLDARDGSNVTIVDGKQIITIDAKGGFTPERSVAKAGLPTIIRFHTSGTFDCSAAVRIPSKNISELLPQTGSTDIDLGTPSAGPLSGSCGMGMYPFEVVFE